MSDCVRAMMKRATVRKRCTECRQWFRPPARLAKQQRVCGEECRRARRRRQARARRALEPSRYREEEVERKRRSRERAAAGRAGAGPSGVGGALCHAPGGVSKSMESRREFDEIWDAMWELSRAGWEREMRRIVREVWRKARHRPGADEELSRAG